MFTEMTTPIHSDEVTRRMRAARRLIRRRQSILSAADQDRLHAMIDATSLFQRDWLAMVIDHEWERADMLREFTIDNNDLKPVSNGSTVTPATADAPPTPRTRRG